MSSAFDPQFLTVGDWPAVVEALAGRQATVDGREAVLEEGYAAITRRVEPFQKALIARAESQIAGLSERTSEAASVAEELRTLAARARDGEWIDLDEFTATDNRAALLLRQGTAAPERVQGLAESLEDPLAALDDMERRMPQLRQPPPFHA